MTWGIRWKVFCFFSLCVPLALPPPEKTQEVGGKCVAECFLKTPLGCGMALERVGMGITPHVPGLGSSSAPGSSEVPWEGAGGGGSGGKPCALSCLVPCALGLWTWWGFCGALGSGPAGEALHPRERRELVRGCYAASPGVREMGWGVGLCRTGALLARFLISLSVRASRPGPV